MEQLINLVTNLGFPIACCLAMGYFIDNMWKKNNETNEKTLIALDKVTETNNQLVLTNQSLISNMDLKVEKIEKKLKRLQVKLNNMLTIYYISIILKLI